MSRPKAGEIWMYPYGNAGDTIPALIVSTFESAKDVYCLYMLAHRIRKDKNNINVTLTSGNAWVDPRKISFAHKDKFTCFEKSVPEDTMTIIRAAAVTALGADIGAQSEVELRLANALSAVESMRIKITELTAQNDAYKSMVDKGLDALCARLGEPQQKMQVQQETKKSPSELDRERRKANRSKYAATQGYINVKAAEMKMPLSTIDRLLGHTSKNGSATGAVSHWARGDSPCKWEELERIFPGIRKEAEEWARNNEINAGEEAEL